MKLTFRELKEYKAVLLKQQKKKCVLCGKKLDEHAVMDVSFSGHVAGMIHKRCNRVKIWIIDELGVDYKVTTEVRKRVALIHDNPYMAIKRVHVYLDGDYSENPLHPSSKA